MEKSVKNRNSTKQPITILGAGIMGLMVAYHLADQYPITLYDPKGFPADNASLMAGGMLAPYSEIEHMDMRWVQAGLKGIEIWQDINLDTGFTQNGSLLIAHPEDRYILERFKTHLPIEKQSYHNVQSLENHIPRHHQNGIFLSEEAHLDPAKTMASLCDYLQNHNNVTLTDDPTFQHSNIPTFQPSNLPTFQHSNTPAFQTIDCRGMASHDPDIRGVKGEILLVRNTEFSLKRPVRLMHPRYPLYIIPRDDDIFMIGATVIESSENENVSLRSGMELMSALYSLHNSFGEADIINIKAGIRPSYADNLPRIHIQDNLITCNGLFRHGYLLAPVMAACVKDYLENKENEYMSLFLKGSQNESNNQRAA